MNVISDEIEDIAREAGEIIMGFYKKVTDVEYKEDKSPLTQADKEAHNFICRELSKRFPNIPVVSEESEPANWARINENIESWKTFWLVDPLDGTKEFIKKSGEFTVNIALIENKCPILGAVYGPAIKTMYVGSVADKKAYKKIGDRFSEKQYIATRKNPDKTELRIVASKDHAGPEIGSFIERLPGQHILKSMGSSLKFCLVAEGLADFYPRFLPTMEWDTAAAHAVVQAAGGQVFKSDGQPFLYGKKGLKNHHFVCLGDVQFEWKNYLI